jgi:hypothetical protein
MGWRYRKWENKDAEVIVRKAVYGTRNRQVWNGEEDFCSSTELHNQKYSPK